MADLPEPEERPQYTLLPRRARGLFKRRDDATALAAMSRLGGQTSAAAGGGCSRAGRSPRGAIVKWIVWAVIGWIVLSVVLFVISASFVQDGIGSAAEGTLSGSGWTLTSANNILVLGSDARAEGHARGRRERRRPEPLGHDPAAAPRRRALVAAVDPARHGRPDPRPRPDKINAAYAIGGAGADRADDRELPPHQDQPRRRDQLRPLPAADRRDGRHRLQRHVRRLEDQRRLQERRLHAAPEDRDPPHQRQAGAGARPDAREPLQPDARTTSPARGASRRSSRR